MAPAEEWRYAGTEFFRKGAVMPRTSKPSDGTSEQPQPRRAAAKRTDPHANGGAGNGAAGNGEAFNGNDEVARRAYEIYQSRGGEHGFDLDHWLEAERQLKPGPTSVTGSLAPESA